jgi:hypothetical protein
MLAGKLNCSDLVLAYMQASPRLFLECLAAEQQSPALRVVVPQACVWVLRAARQALSCSASSGVYVMHGPASARIVCFVTDAPACSQPASLSAKSYVVLSQDGGLV